MNLARQIAIVGERRHKTADGYNAAIGEQFGHLSHTSNVLLTVSLAEAQILVEAGANVVAVQTVRRNALRHQVGFQLEGNRCFAGAAKPGQPDSAAVEAAIGAELLAAELPRNVVLLLGDIGGHLQTLCGTEEETYTEWCWLKSCTDVVCVAACLQSAATTA